MSRKTIIVIPLDEDRWPSQEGHRRHEIMEKIVFTILAICFIYSQFIDK